MTERIPSAENYRPYFGASLCENGALFSFASRSATGARILFYDSPDDEEPSRVLSFDPSRDREGDVWKLFVPGIAPGALYHFQVDGPYRPENGDYFDGRARLIDPFAKALAGEFLPKRNGVCFPPKCVVVDDSFDWEGVRSPKRDLADEVIYELHVRGFTRSESSGVSKPGTFLGLIEKIPYLQSLGITAVELLPICEFPRVETDGSIPRRANYWGYDPIAFFAPHRGYAWSSEPGAQVAEFKQTVKEFHRAGIEVYLDVVFNHTAERDRKFETFSFKGLENRAYYLTDRDGDYLNYSGCGNAVRAANPWTRNLILDCLRSWAINYRIDGFRFDLASALNRDADGRLLSNSPTVEAIAEDPFLAGVKLIAEPWDCGGAYQVGSFGGPRWSEWNGKFRDDVRRFWRGDDWLRGTFATRFGGSSDLYQRDGRSPSASVNFVVAHDGFTLNDLVSYERKRNEDNGEENRDGESNNFSRNFGVEGETDDPSVESARERQIRNFLTTLLLSQGVPMLAAGDEIRRTQKGNNNAYCQDSPISWFDWELAERNQSLKRFCAALIRFRRQTASLRRRDFFSGRSGREGDLPDVSWFDASGNPVDWNDGGAKTLACLIPALSSAEGEPSNRDVLAVFNASDRATTFRFPELAKGSRFAWRLFVDSGAEPPRDVYPEADGPSVSVDDELTLPELTTRVYVSDASRSAN
ncbi:MAG: glycogen debranching protein GlgX [Thermoguttaceae bacterium]|nr:glycogen debranching protein GlgX [Thermoguttaceae bacterium]